LSYQNADSLLLRMILFQLNTMEKIIMLEEPIFTVKII